MEVSNERLAELIERTVIPEGRDAYGLSNQETAAINTALRELLQLRAERKNADWLSREARQVGLHSPACASVRFGQNECDCGAAMAAKGRDERLG